MSYLKHWLINSYSQLLILEIEIGMGIILSRMIFQSFNFIFYVVYKKKCLSINFFFKIVYQ